MRVIQIDTSDPKKLEERPSFETLSAGKHRLRVTKKLEVEKAKSSDNNIVKVELECIDEGEDKGRKVWDTLVLVKSSEWKIYQLAKACGVSVGADGQIDLDAFAGAVCEAITKQETYQKVNPDTNKSEPAVRATIVEYLFERSQ